MLDKILKDNYQTFILNSVNEKNEIAKQIDSINQKLSTARDKLLSEIIEDEEYLGIKKGVQNSYRKAGRRIKQIRRKRELSNINKIIKTTIEGITNIAKLYADSEIKEKRNIP